MVDFTGYGLAEAKANDFETLPAGEYHAVIVDMDEKPTKDGTGKRLNVKLQIASGKYQNRTIFDGLNIQNRSEVAQKIGIGQLKSLCIAAGVENPKSSQELIGKSLIVKLKVGKDQNQNDRNEVTSYKAFIRPSAAPAGKQTNMMEQAFGQDEPKAATSKTNPWA